MFETAKSRRDFITALKAGKVGSPILQKAMATVNAFTDCSLEEISWTFNHKQPLVKQFGASVLEIIEDPSKLTLLMDQYRAERNPERIEQLAKSIVEGSAPDLYRQLSLMVNQADINMRQKAQTLLVRCEDWPKQKTLVRALLNDPKPVVSELMLKHVIRASPRAYLRELKAAAAHPNQELRGLCLKALIGMDSIKLATVLIDRLAQEKGELQKSLYGALTTFIERDAAAMMEMIVSKLASSEEKVRRTAMNLLLKLPEQKEAFRRLLTFSESLSAMPRDQLFSEMAQNAEVWVEHVLSIFKTEKNSALRLQAMNLAKVLKHSRLSPIFLHEMKNSDWMVRYAAMQVLGDMKSQQALPALVDALGNDETSLAAIQALDKFRDIRLAKPFFQRMPNAGETEQIELLKALNNIGDTRLLPPLAKFLDSNAPKGKAKKFAAETVIGLCNATGTTIPAKVTQIYEGLRERSVTDLPDLGLRISED